MKLLRFLLFPLAILYDVVTTIRNYFFTAGIFKSTKFQVPVIAVGNLSVGGTGKSPQIEYLIRLLKKDYKIAVLSRGYKRKTKGFQLLSNTHTATHVGDEPMQFYKKFKNEIQVAVDANRVNGIEQLLKLPQKPEVVLLDDAYQHRKVTASTYILLTKYDNLYVNDFILPTGNLRESSRGAKRADAIVVTKCPRNLSGLEQNAIRKKIAPLAMQKVFFSTIIYNEILGGGQNLSIEDLKDVEVVLVTGIANPKSLLEYLKKRKIVFKHIAFPDHHSFTKEDIHKIEQEFTKINTSKKYIITTEKDYVRLEGRLENLVYITIKNEILNEENDFDVFIRRSISNYI